MIFQVKESDYLELIGVWQSSVQATHDFLSEEEIISLRQQILKYYFDAVSLTCIKDKAQNILGFCGVCDHKIEMLFIATDAQGQGIGTKLCRDAIKNHYVNKVDVNEQNPRAIEFYKKMGFEIKGRSPFDGQSRPYPILHMELELSQKRD